MVTYLAFFSCPSDSKKIQTNAPDQVAVLWKDAKLFSAEIYRPNDTILLSFRLDSSFKKIGHSPYAFMKDFYVGYGSATDSVFITSSFVPKTFPLDSNDVIKSLQSNYPDCTLKNLQFEKNQGKESFSFSIEGKHLNFYSFHIFDQANNLNIQVYYQPSKNFQGAKQVSDLLQRSFAYEVKKKK